MPVCRNQRGHSAESHHFPEGRQAYGVGAQAVKELKQTFERYRPNLTRKEKLIIEEYEERNVDRSTNRSSRQRNQRDRQ